MAHLLRFLAKFEPLTVEGTWFVESLVRVSTKVIALCLK